MCSRRCGFLMRSLTFSFLMTCRSNNLSMFCDFLIYKFKYCLYNTHRNVRNNKQAQSSFRNLLKNTGYCIEYWMILYACQGQTLSICVMCVCDLGGTKSPASFIRLFGVCCHRPNLHVDINSLWSLTELMNVDYASWYSATCRSGCSCTYTCI